MSKGYRSEASEPRYFAEWGAGHCTHSAILTEDTYASPPHHIFRKFVPQPTVNEQKLSKNNPLSAADLRTSVYIKGARANNLKNIDLVIPKNQLVVVTGVSGSGKSSITMDTLFAEGQRRYVESLSSYARQFLMRMKKPEVDYIRGICPAIAIEQKTTTANARSTVGTLTEVYDFLRLLYARAGRTFSPVSGEEVRRHTVTDVVNHITGLPDKSRVYLYAPLPRTYDDRTLQRELELLQQKGYTRILASIGKEDPQGHPEVQDIADALETNAHVLFQTLGELTDEQQVMVLIDRFVVTENNEENERRIADSVQTAFGEGGGEVIVWQDQENWTAWNNRFELDDMTFVEPSPALFNYNNPFGACPKCEGFGRTMGIDEDKVIPDPAKSVYDGAVAPWSGATYGQWQKDFVRQASKFQFPVHTPYADLSRDEKRELWDGNRHVGGINNFFDDLGKKLYKIQNRIMLARYRGRTICPTCRGGRLRREAEYVKVAGKSITDLLDLPIDLLQKHFLELELNEHDRTIAKRLLLEINNRLQSMMDLGLNYLDINRLSNTLVRRREPAHQPHSYAGQ